MTKGWEDYKVEKSNIKPTLYLIRGVSGAGKSTFAKQLFNSGLVADVYEADQWFVNNNNNTFDVTKLWLAHKACQQWTKIALDQNLSIAVSNTSTTEKEVQVYQDIATAAGANFVSLVVENRNNTTNVHNVPEETIEKMRKRFTFKL
jgi:predicted kinase